MKLWKKVMACVCIITVMAMPMYSYDLFAEDTEEHVHEEDFSVTSHEAETEADAENNMLGRSMGTNDNQIKLDL